MGTYCEISNGYNHQDAIRERLGSSILLLNELGNSQDEIDALNMQIATTLNGDMTIRPSCVCRKTVAPLSSNVVCDVCNTKVTNSTDKEIEPIIFLKSPKGIDNLLLPIFVMYFVQAFNYTKFDTFKYLTDPKFKIKDKNNVFVADILACKIPRGWNYFINNTLEIMETLAENVDKLKKSQKVADTIQVFKDNQNDILCDSICFTSNSLFIIERNGTGAWLDSKNVILHNSISGFAGIDLMPTLVDRQRCLSVNYSLLITHMLELMRKNFKGRNGYFRASLVAAKGIYIGRAVAAGITDPLKYDEIELPWGILIAMLRTHIVSVLLRTDPQMTYCDKLNFVRESINVPNAKMKNIISELLNNANGGKGLAVIVQRFPSLQTGSFMLMYCKNHGSNPRDNAIKFPLPSTRSSNLDFDGDSTHVSLLVTCDLADGFRNMEYHTNCLDPLMPKKLNNNVALTNETYTNVISRNDYYNAHQSEDVDDVNEIYDMFGI